MRTIDPKQARLQPAAMATSAVALAMALVVTGCDPAGSSHDAGAPPRPTASALSEVPGYDPQWRPVTSAASTRGGADPLGRAITLAEATVDLPGTGPLVAELQTSMGELRCTLMPERAPRTVAQFVGLANGTRPYRTRRGWVKKPAYDGSHVHRVVVGALVVGGRPADAHTDGIGLVTAPEPWPGMRHDEAGLLCSAGRGRVGAGELLLTGSDASLSPVDGGPPAPTVFGRCEPAALADRMTRVPSARGRPQEAIVLRRVRVRRGSSTGSGTTGPESKPNSGGGVRARR